MEGLPWSAGALLYVRQEQPETLQPGDTIAYVTDSDLSLEGGVIGSVDTERRFFYVEGAPVYWDNVLGQPLWGIDGLGYVSRLYQPARRDCIWCWGLLWCWRCCASSPCDAERERKRKDPPPGDV